MADARLLGNGKPGAAPSREQGPHFNVQRVLHGPNIAKLCYANTQYFACKIKQTRRVGSKSINQVFAENLRRRMDAQGHSQASLARKVGVAQRTIGNYLNPKDRDAGAKGKEPSAKLTEMAMVASAVGLEPWEMLIPQGDAADVEMEKLAIELDALFRGMPKNAQVALIEQARIVHRVTKADTSREETSTRSGEALLKPTGTDS